MELENQKHNKHFIELKQSMVKLGSDKYKITINNIKYSN